MILNLPSKTQWNAPTSLDTLFRTNLFPRFHGNTRSLLVIVKISSVYLLETDLLFTYPCPKTTSRAGWPRKRRFDNTSIHVSYIIVAFSGRLNRISFSDVDQQLGNITDLTTSHMETRSKVGKSSSAAAAAAPTPFDDPSSTTPADIHTIRYARFFCLYELIIKCLPLFWQWFESVVLISLRFDVLTSAAIKSNERKGLFT